MPPFGTTSRGYRPFSLPTGRGYPGQTFIPGRSGVGTVYIPGQGIINPGTPARTAAGVAGISAEDFIGQTGQRLRSAVEHQEQPVSPEALEGTSGPSRIRATTTEHARTAEQLEGTRSSEIARLRRAGISPDDAENIVDYYIEKARAEFGRPSTLLGWIGRGLAAIESAQASFFRGASEKDVEYANPNDPTTWPRAPWAFIQKLGAGFKEIPGGITDTYTFDEYLKEYNDPNTFLYKNSRPIGLTLSILYDPLTYLSVGATAASRKAAAEAVGRSSDQSWLEADALIKKHPAKFKNMEIEDVAEMIHLQQGRPFTTGDALTGMRTQTMAAKDAAMWGAQGVRAMAGAWLLPTTAKGGRGIRFAGMEVPGTPQLGEKIGQSFRARREAAYLEGSVAPLAHMTGNLIIPQNDLKVIADDGLRASALIAARDLQQRVGSIIPDVWDRTLPMAEVRVSQYERIAPEQAEQVIGGRAVGSRGVVLHDLRGITDDPFLDPPVPIEGNIERVERASDARERTFLFTDVVGSTEMAAKGGVETAVGTRRLHDEVVERAVREHNGHVVNSTGDGLLARFDEPDDALLAAQSARAAAESLPIDLRIGVHSGRGWAPVKETKNLEKFGDVVGPDVNLAARVMSAAEPGGITASRGTVEGIAGLDTVEMGAVNLKGVPDPVDLVSVDVPKIVPERSSTVMMPKSVLDEMFDARESLPRPAMEAEAVNGVLDTLSDVRKLVKAGNLPPGQIGALTKVVNNRIAALRPRVEEAFAQNTAFGDAVEEVSAVVAPAFGEVMQRAFSGVAITREQAFATAKNMIQQKMDDLLIANGYTGLSFGDGRYLIFEGSKGMEKFRKGVHPAQQAQRNLLRSEEHFLNPEDRAKLLQDRPATTDAQRAFRRDVNLRYGQIKKMGVKSGSIDKNKAEAMWERLKWQYDDPLEALAEYDMRMSMLSVRDVFMKELLNKPRFARKISDKKEGPSHYSMTMEEAHERRWEIFRYRGKDYAVPPQLYDGFDAMRNTAGLSRELSEFLRLINIPQNWWKLYATSLNPSFHTMNFLGAVWNNMLAGVYNPINYLQAYATHYQARMSDYAVEGRRTPILRRVPKQTERRKQARQVVSEAEKRRVLGRATFVRTELRPARDVRDIHASGPRVERTPVMTEAFAGAERLSALERLYRVPGKSTKAGLITRGRQAGAITAGITSGPFLGLILGLPELAKAGRFAAERIEDVVRLAPFMKFSKDKWVKQYMHSLGPITIPGMKHPSFEKNQQAIMYDVGAEISRHFQFDYGNLTDFERRWVKTIFPFWTFYKNNMMVQMSQVVQQPVKYATALKTMNFINEQSGPDMGEQWAQLLPVYFDQLEAFRVPVPGYVRNWMGFDSNEPIYLNPKLPFIQLNMFPPVWDLFRDTGESTWVKWGRIAAPSYGQIGPWSVGGSKTMLEVITNRQLGLGRPIDYQRAESAGEWRQSFVDVPSYAHWLPGPLKKAFGLIDSRRGLQMPATHKYIMDIMASPFITNLGKSMPISDEGFRGQRAKADMISWLTGVRLMPVDPVRLNRSWSYALEGMLEAKRAELQEQGLELNPDDELALDNIRSLIQIVNELWDIREEEIYGPSE